MTFDRSTTREIVIGAPVYTRDNEKLGEVKEVRGGAFKVAADMQPDYWLPTTCLSTLSTGTTERLMVDTTKDHIGDFKIDEPRGR